MTDPLPPPMGMQNVNRPTLRMERVLLGKEIFMFPESLVGQASIFQHVVSLDTWNNILSEKQRDHLKNFLPKFPSGDSSGEKEETVRRLFCGENFKFGNPLQKFNRKLKDGMLSPEIAKSVALCRKFKRREYRFSQQMYYSQLLQETIINRERTLNMCRSMPPDTPLSFQHAEKPQRGKEFQLRMLKLYKRTLRDARLECNLVETSSDEEDIVVSAQRGKRHLPRPFGQIPSPEPTVPSVVTTYVSQPSATIGDNVSAPGMTSDTVSHGDGSGIRLRTLSPVEVTEEHYRRLLRQHRNRRLHQPDVPEMDVAGITLQDVRNRCQDVQKSSIHARTASAMCSEALATDGESPGGLSAKKKQRLFREKVDKSARHKFGHQDNIPQVEESSCAMRPIPSQLDMGSDLLSQRDDDGGGVPDIPLPDTLPARTTDSFFSLLRDIFTEFPDAKTSVVEERVQRWLHSPASSLCFWPQADHNWVSSVSSALKFLSGDMLEVDVENFVPFLDYKERAQHWVWIGSGRDSNSQLTPLCQHWLRLKSSRPANSLTSTETAPAVVRPKTNFVVRPTTGEEKRKYREQEVQRFNNPHLSFTYHLHGYDSVVGPVKGVYSKDSVVTKAREHTLLVSDRPAYVTILTLVRDAAARLPNGEGTRGDICELLKDSQFLCPGVTDTQINTVVSGALDRLHSEKDPCVKYDVNSKMWMFLHRRRTQEEFERIHQAHGAAVKAKKSLQRPKLSKMIKDHVSLSSSLPGSSDSPQAVAPETATPVANGTLKSGLADRPQLASSDRSRLPLQAPTLSMFTQSKSIRGDHDVGFKVDVSVRDGTNSTPAPVTLSMTVPSVRRSLSSVSSTSSWTLPTCPSNNKGRSPTIGQAICLHRSYSDGSKVGMMPHSGSSTGRIVPTAIAVGTGSVLKPMLVAVTKQGLALTSGMQLAGVVRGGCTRREQQGAPRLAGHAPTISPVDGSVKAADPSSKVKANFSWWRADGGTGSVASTTQPATTPSAPCGGLMGRTTDVGRAGEEPLITRLVEQVAGSQQAVPIGNRSPDCFGLAGASRSKYESTLKVQGKPPQHAVLGAKALQLGGKPVIQLGVSNVSPSLTVLQTSHGFSSLSLISQRPPSSSPLCPTVTSANSLAGKVTITTIAPSNLSHGRTFVVASSRGIMQSTPTRVIPQSHSAVILSPAISVRHGLSSSGQGAVASGPRNLVSAQFIVQQANASDLLHVASVDGHPVSRHPARTSVGVVAKLGSQQQHSIQMMQGLLSQQGVRHGQAAIMISQPAALSSTTSGGPVLKPYAHVVQANPQALSATGCKAAATGVGKASPKAKPQPVYARIITPPPGLKLTTMVAPTAIQATRSSVNMLQNVSRLIGLPQTASAVAGRFPGRTNVNDHLSPSSHSSSRSAPTIIVPLTGTVTLSSCGVLGVSQQPLQMYVSVDEAQSGTFSDSQT